MQPYDLRLVIEVQRDMIARGDARGQQAVRQTVGEPVGLPIGKALFFEQQKGTFRMLGRLGRQQRAEGSVVEGEVKHGQSRVSPERQPAGAQAIPGKDTRRKRQLAGLSND